MIGMQPTVSASTVYGYSDPKSLSEVFEHWTNDWDCAWHNGPYSYLTRSALEKDNQYNEVHFRYNAKRDMVVLRLVHDENPVNGRKDGWYADTGDLPQFVCKLLCENCDRVISDKWKAKHDAAHHATVLGPRVCVEHGWSLPCPSCKHNAQKESSILHRD